MGGEFHPNEDAPQQPEQVNQTGPVTQTESVGENAPRPAGDPLYNVGALDAQKTEYPRDSVYNSGNRSDSPEVNRNDLSETDRKELEDFRAQKAMRASQTSPDGPNYQQNDPDQTGTLVEPPHPDTIGYHPHVGDHSIDPLTQTVPQQNSQA